MEQMYSKVKALIHQRKLLQEKRFYIDLTLEKENVWENISFVRKREWLGIIQTNTPETFLVPPVFDNISSIDNSNIAMLSIDGLWGIYNIITKQWGILPICKSLLFHEEYNTIELVTSQGHGLYSIQDNDIVISPKYDDVTCYSNGDYLWVRLGKWYHFVKKNNGMLITVEALKAYDTPHGIYALAKDNKVFCANEEGLDNSFQLRDFVIKNHGRGRLYNYKMHNMDIIDIYGFVLNER